MSDSEFDTDEIVAITTAKNLTTLEVALDELGMPAAEKRALLRRMGKKTKVDLPKKVTTPWIIEQLEKKLALALSYVDEHTLASANLRDLGGLVAILVDRRQLLRGEPTQIASVEDNRAVDQLAPLLIREMVRRGMDVPGIINLPTEQYEVLGKNTQTPKRKKLSFIKGR